MTKSNLTLEAVVKQLDIKKPTAKYLCKFCNKGFVKETTLAVHMCEQKQRHASRDEPGIRMAFQAFTRFYESTQVASKVRTFDDFATSPYYNAFAKFGRYIVSISAINPSQFIEWVLKSGKKIDSWATDRVYEQYLHYYIANESVTDALERGIKHALKWAADNNSQYSDYFRYAGANTICSAIFNGKISPWILYSCDQGQAFLNSNLTVDQMGLIWPAINPDLWKKKILKHKDDWEYAKQILEAAGW